ncbi:hypothetical protein NM688_g8548 [Phlebia brevispora]|uniref:Uncharacterized protein n=1 Tax=Phlebia brevispora TaxID=194682 RepID=A0ACC1RS97_9APHY|nr:hypothetical protein NM688_g8548 [Phlebia brevispora]
MKSKVRPSDIPEWDGRDSSALRWFADIQEFAANGGYIPWQMAPHMWQRLKEGSGPRLWYQTLAPDLKAYMRQHYLHFLTVVRSHYLGDRWLQLLNSEYRVQAFRQKGHSKETPLDFIQWWILYVRMLLHVPVGGHEEVQEVMEKAPVSWKTILNVQAQPFVVHLQARVREMSPQLIDAHRMVNRQALTEDMLLALLRSMGHMPPRKRARPQTKSTIPDEQGTDADSPRNETDPLNVDSMVIRELYATTKKRQRPPPKGGYPFPRNDLQSVVRPPPSPCKCCGSPLHWDRECPHYSKWEAKFGKRAQIGETHSGDDWEHQPLYDTAFEELNRSAAFSPYVEAALLEDRWTGHDQLVALGLASEPSSRVATPLWRKRTAYVEDEEEAPETVPGGVAVAYLIEDVDERVATNLEGTEEALPSPHELSDVAPAKAKPIWVEPR